MAKYATAGINLARAISTSVVVSIAFGVLPVFFGSDTFRLSQFEAIGGLMLVAIGLNIVTGFAGQLTLGPSAVFTIGAFTAIVFANHYPKQASLFLLCVIGAASAAIGGLVIGLPSLRIGGFYLALVTLFVASAVPAIAGAWSVTGANSGISLVSNIDFTQHTKGMMLYEVMVAIIAAALIGSAVLRRSRLGRRMFVLKASEELAASLGCSTFRLKMMAFMISAVMAGVGGGMYVYSQQYMSASSANVNTSIYLLAACAIGGLGSAAGPAIGMAFVYGLQDFVGLDKYTDLIFGGSLALVALLLPEGLLGAMREAWGWVRSRNVSRDLGLTVEPSGLSVDEVADYLGHRDEGSATLAATDLYRSFGGVAAVAGVSLTVRPGTVHGLIGSNGSGKTTVLNLISGFYRPDSGRVEIGGRTVKPGHPEIGVGVGLARSFQTPKLVDHDTVFGNVDPLRRVNGRGDATESVMFSLRLTGLEALADVQVKKLPHGTRRLVEIARAVALKPQFILFDEPAAGLTGPELNVLRQAIRTLAEAGAAILLVEHNVPLVAELATEVTVMHLGKAIAQGDPAVVLHDENVARAFLGATAPVEAETRS